MNPIELLTQGGPLMIVLFALSVLGCALIILKFLHFRRADMPEQQVWDELAQNYSRERFESFSEYFRTSPSLIGRIFSPLSEARFRSGISNKELEIELGRLASKEIRSLEEWLRPLAVISQLAPLLGLLGTVLGMIEVFAQLEGAGANVNPGTLAGGIWEALLTTAAGLAIAIPGSAAYSYFEGEVDKRAAQISDFGKRLLFKRRLILEGHSDDEFGQELSSPSDKTAFC